MGLLAAAARLPRSPLMCALLHRAQHTLSLSMIRQVSGVHAGAGAALARPAAAPTLPAAAPARAVRSYAARRMQLGSPYRKGLNMKRLEQGRKPVLKQVEVDVGSEGFEESQELQLLLEQLEEDGKAVVREAMKLKVAANPRYKLPQVANLSLVLCDDATIQGMNKEHRGKDEPTDVLSFEIQDDYDGKIALPVKLLGDLVISIDTAARQAEERQHDLLDELRVLLVHGVLHLCGYDHEAGPQQARAMSQAEAAVMAACGWDSDGLISASERSAANDSDGYEDDDDGGGNVDPSPASRPSAPASTSSSSSSGSGAAKAQQFVFRSSSVRLVALDMDGTLLDSKGRIRPSAVAAIKAACAQGTQVVLATGKARPAALKACTLAGLAGDGLVISPRRPGVFLQGLAVHGSAGQQLSDAQVWNSCSVPSGIHQAC